MGIKEDIERLRREAEENTWRGGGTGARYAPPPFVPSYTAPRENDRGGSVSSVPKPYIPPLSPVGVRGAQGGVTPAPPFEETVKEFVQQLRAGQNAPPPPPPDPELPRVGDRVYWNEAKTSFSRLNTGVPVYWDEVEQKITLTPTPKPYIWTADVTDHRFAAGQYGEQFNTSPLLRPAKDVGTPVLRAYRERMRRQAEQWNLPEPAYLPPSISPPVTQMRVFANNEGGVWQPYVLSSAPQGLFEGFVAVTTEPFQGISLKGATPIWDFFYNGLMFLKEVAEASFFRSAGPAFEASTGTFVQTQWEQVRHYQNRLVQTWNEIWAALPSLPVGDDIISQAANRQYGSFLPPDPAVKQAQIDEADALRQQAYADLDTLRSSGDFITPDAFTDIRESIRSAIQLDRQSLDWDPYQSFSWAAYPDKEARFIEAAIDAEIQLGRPMTRWEVVSLRRGFEDINAQFVGEVVFDWTNFIPVVLMDKMIVGPIKHLLKSFKTDLVASNLAAPVVRFFTERATSSAARQVRDNAWVIVYDSARHSPSIDGLVKQLDDYATALGMRGEVDSIELATRLRSANPDLGPAQINFLRRMADVIPPTTADGVSTWGRLVETARSTRYNQALEEATETLRAMGNLTDEVINERAALIARELADDPKQLAPVVASLFETRLRQSHVVPWSRLIYDDSLSAGVVRAFENITGGPQQGLRSAADTIARGGNFIHRVWVQAVLSARPAWVVRNYIDSTFRYLVYGGRLFDDWEALRIPYANGDKIFPVEFIQAFAHEFMPGSSSVEARMIYEGKFPGGFFSDWGALWKKSKWQALNPINAFRTWKNSWTDLNRAIEYSLRVRLFEQTAAKTLSQLSPLALERSLANVPEAMRPLARQIWNAARGDPQRFGTLVDSVFTRQKQGRVIWRNLVPDAVRDTFLGRSLDNELRAIGQIEERLYLFISNEMERGVDVKNINLDKFFDDVLKDIADFAEKSALAKRAIIESASEVPTRPNTASSMEEVMVDMLDEPAAAERALQEANDAAGEVAEQVYDATNRAPGGSLYTLEQENIIRQEQEAVFARYYDTIAKSEMPIEAKAILERQVSQYRNYFSRLQRFRLEVFPGPLFQQLLAPERKIAWDQVAALRTAAAETVSDSLDNLFKSISGLSPEEAKALPDLDLDTFLNSVGITVTRSPDGAVLEVRQALSNLPGMPPEMVSTSAYTRSAFQSILERTADDIKPVAEAVVDIAEGATPAQTQDIEQMWLAWAKSQDLFKQYGTKARSYSGFVKYINEQIAAAKKLGTEEGSVILAAWQRRLKEAKDSLTWMRQFRFGDIRGVPPLPMGAPPVARWEMSEGLQTWLRDQDRMASDFAAVQDAVEVWRESLRAMQADGSIFTLPDKATAGVIKSWAPDARGALADAQNTSYYGGISPLLPGIEFEGAIPATNRIMLDYASFSRFDQTMKSVVPFWMFPSRSIPFWVETLGLRPQITSFYAKYMRASQRFTLQRGGLRGGTNSMGEPLPSLAGYIPIPGTDIWFNLLSALSFRYIIPTYTQRYDDASEDKSMFQQVIQSIHDTSRQFGFNTPPWISWLLYSANVLDPNLTPQQSWVPQTALIPPNLMRSINRSLNRMAAPFELPEYWEPEVGWKDFLIERRVLTEANKRIQDGAGSLSAEEKLVIASEAWGALRKREGNPLWDSARDQLDEENWIADVAGYFTGQNGKIFTDAGAYLIQLRIYNNRLRETINNQVNAQLFDLDAVAEDRYKFYYEEFVPSAEGMLSGLMTDISFVTDPEDSPLYGIDRRGMLEQDWQIKQTRDAYYLKIEQIAEERDAALLALPIGAPSASTSKVWDTYFAELAEVETKYKFPRYPWAVGVHTPKQIQDHFLYEWNALIKKSEPRWDPEAETYLEYTARRDVWLNELPNLTEGIVRVMNVVLQGYGLDAPTKEELLNRVREITNKEGFEKYRLENDMAWEAVDAAWEALRWTPYWEAVENLSGAERELAQREYLETNGGTLTLDQAYAWITEKYGGRFTREEIEKAMLGRDQYDIDARQEETDAAKYGEELAAAHQDVWDLLSLASLQDRSTDLRNALALAGGDPDLIDVWYTSGGNPNAFSSTEGLIAFRDLLKKALATLDLSTPTKSQLEEKAMADELDEAFEKLVVQELGAAALQLQSIYLNLTTSARSSFRKDRPLDYATIQAIYDLKDSFAVANPIWGKYYWPQEGSTGGGGGGTSSAPSSKSIVTTYRAPRELYGLNSSDKEKLKLYYEGKGGLKDKFKERLNAIWIELGKPGGSLNNWIQGELKRKFTTTKKSRGGGGGRGGGGSSGGSRGGGGSASPWGTVRLGRRSTLSASQLLDPGQLGRGGVANAPYLPPAVSETLGAAATSAVEKALREGSTVDKDTQEYLESILQRHPEWNEYLKPVFHGSSYKAKGGARPLPN